MTVTSREIGMITASARISIVLLEVHWAATVNDQIECPF